ncbi:thioredoxin domain-containing protein [Salinirubrum litoreum]|uniref:Thioredoxin domain-containing protein n=1 Tax=Salinirubrum litoreum TaxID=1126234 RepID=A0ABD5RC05_9EURY|nr:thioredoxin domain-containing protein [Salinirubrum litoreum]
MTDNAGRNRLDAEESPYLRQHADNPVHWQPWDSDALDEAQEREVPIFLSVGYSACHWCHVMAEESFEDERTAEILNENFVPIKVDREERPDLDRIYQTICQLTTGRGGWPLSVWLTPEGKPFYVGTYFPNESRQGMPAFPQLLRDIAHSWADPEQRSEMENRAQQWTAALTDQLESTPDAPGETPDESVLDDAVSAAIRSADREYGGFGTGGPKFPQPGRVELLLQSYADSGREQALDVAVGSLDAMATGGLYDHVGGGFHRYCTDRKWVVPHFEKMLYDNAEIPKAMLSGYQATGEDRYAALARETFAFVDRELTHSDGGAFSTLDARSEGDEGKFYVWTPSQVHDAVADETTAAIFCDRFGVEEGGNFEGGRTVLTVSKPVEALADDYDLAVQDVESRLAEAREQVFAARAERVRPARDEKVLAAWNGLLISALARGERVLGPTDAGDDAWLGPDESGEGDGTVDYAGQAEAALSFVREHLWDAETERLSRRYADGDVKGAGFLEDYAFLARAAFDLYGATGDVSHLAFALDLARVIADEFWDPAEGTIYFTPDDGEPLVARPQELTDQSTPSSLGVAVGLLADLDHFVPHAEFGDIADRVLATHSTKLSGSPMEHVSLALAAAKRATGSVEVTVAAETVPDAWRERLAETYLPGAVFAPRPATDAELADWLDTLGLDEAPPIWAGREATEGEPTVYVCENFTCSPPQTDIDAALDWVAQGRED